MLSCSRFTVHGSRFVFRFAFTVLVVLGSLFGTACATGRAASVPVPRPFPGAPAPNPEPRTSNPEPGTRTENTNPEPGIRNPELLSTALSFRGAPYRNGGSDPSGFDCSGFVQWVFAQHRLRLPREVRDQWRLGRDIDRDEIHAGDLVFFETVSRGASHVGIALGGDQFVHAPSSKGVVRVERFSSAYWSSRWVGARRLLPDAAPGQERSSR
jgi:cell wall-associated NlpC family hydrolase